MEFRNHTPFPALAFQMQDWDEKEYHVVVMRATMEIADDGALRFSEEQAPLAVTDEYFGELNKSSVRQESDLAPSINPKDFSVQHVILRTEDPLQYLQLLLLILVPRWMMLSSRNSKVQVTWNYSLTGSYPTEEYFRQ